MGQENGGGLGSPLKVIPHTQQEENQNQPSSESLLPQGETPGTNSGHLRCPCCRDSSAGGTASQGPQTSSASLSPSDLCPPPPELGEYSAQPRAQFPHLFLEIVTV